MENITSVPQSSSTSSLNCELHRKLKKINLSRKKVKELLLVKESLIHAIHISNIVGGIAQGSAKNGRRQKWKMKKIEDDKN